jgi:cation diffusion facilitator family transporter
MHHHHDSLNSSDSRYTIVRNTSLLGALVNTLLGIFKIIVGTVGHSHALVADGIHSFADLLTDALVVFAARWGGQRADDDHQYGHGRIETVAAVFMAVLLTFVGIVIILEAVSAFFSPLDETPSMLAVMMAIAGILAKEALFQYTHYIAQKVHSDLLRASAWHHRSDAASSTVVLLGVIASKWFALDYIDSFAALIVGMLIIKMGWDIGWRGLRELIDTSVEPALLVQLTQTIQAVPGVIALHELRTRYVANKVFLDVHVIVAEKISVSEGHFIGDHVHRALKDAFPMIEDMVVHVDPEDDSDAPVIHNALLDRAILLPTLTAAWAQLPYAAQVEAVTLHYLGHTVDVDVRMKMDSASAFTTAELASLNSQYQQALASFAFIRHVTCLATV